MVGNELVEIVNNQPVTSSRQVAEYFRKEHKDVLESIREILVAEFSAARFFYKTTYENRGKQYPEYLMNRDGFALLAMGFRGKKALRWKIRYIQAFNEMQERLEKAGSSKRDELRRKMGVYTGKRGTTFPMGWATLYRILSVRHGFNLKEQADAEKMKPLDYIEKYGLIDEALSLADDLIGLFEIRLPI